MAFIGYKDLYTMKRINVLSFNEWLLATHNYLPQDLDHEMHFDFLQEYVYEYITEKIDEMWNIK